MRSQAGPHHVAYGKVAVLTQSFADAVLEAEKIIAAAPHVQTDQDLAEGYD